MYIMMDKSGSMTDAVSGGTKWTAVKAAISGFVDSPNSAGIGVGIQYFPLPISGLPACPTNCGDCPCLQSACACTSCRGINGTYSCLAQSMDVSCVTGDYANPAVPIGLLPATAQAIKNSMGLQSPSGNTPTAAALRGALQYTKAWASANPTHAVITVLATDGMPTSCAPQDIPSIAQIASDGCNNAPKVSTFVIGVGKSLGNLNGIASGGCTGQALVVDTGGDVVKQFQDALDKIRKTALGCQFLIPTPGGGGQMDYGKVNVQFTPSAGPVAMLRYVSDKASCDPSTGGWYYDDRATPTKIVLCDGSCTTVQADAQGKIDVVLGCATQQ